MITTIRIYGTILREIPANGLKISYIHVLGNSILHKSRTVAFDFRVSQSSKKEKTTRWGMYRLSGCGLHPYRMYPTTGGLSHGLNKCPPDTCLPCLQQGRPFDSRTDSKKKLRCFCIGVFCYAQRTGIEQFNTTCRWHVVRRAGPRRHHNVSIPYGSLENWLTTIL